MLYYKFVSRKNALNLEMAYKQQRNISKMQLAVSPPSVSTTTDNRQETAIFEQLDSGAYVCVCVNVRLARSFAQICIFLLVSTVQHILITIITLANRQRTFLLALCVCLKFTLKTGSYFMYTIYLHLNVYVS